MRPSPTSATAAIAAPTSASMADDESNEITPSPPVAAGAGGAPRREAAAEPEVVPLVSELPDDHDVDLDDLIDAPPESVKSPIERLAEAFPGSELIDEAG